MHNIRARSIVLILFNLLGALFVSSVLAQSDPSTTPDFENSLPTDLRTLPFDQSPQLRSYFADTFQQPVDSPVMQRIFQALKQGESPPQGREDQLIRQPHSVIRHIRAKEGIGLPTSEEVAKIKGDIATMNQEFATKFMAEDSTQKALDDSVKQIALEAEKKVVPPILTSCPEDITKMVSLEDGEEVRIVKDEQVLGDMLFIKGRKPMDTDLAFGVGTTVVEYGTEENDYVSYVASTQGIECLPYRIRFTEGHVVHDLGLNALKNYDSNPKGELYEGIKQRLAEYR